MTTLGRLELSRTKEANSIDQFITIAVAEKLDRSAHLRTP